MTTRMAATVLGMLGGVICAAVAVAQTVPDCQAMSNQQFQAAHEQYEREVRACKGQSACLQDSYNRWITASNKARQAGAACKTQQPAPGISQKATMDPSATPAPAPPPPAGGSLQGSVSQSGMRTPSSSTYPEPKMLPMPGSTSTNRKSLATGARTNAESGYKVGRQYIETPVARQPDKVVVTIQDSDGDGQMVEADVGQLTSGGRPVPHYWTRIKGIVRRSHQKGTLDSFQVIALSHNGVWTTVPTPLNIKLCPPTKTPACSP